MAKCERQGTLYKRHQFRNDGKCKRCGAPKRKHARTGRQAFIRSHSRRLLLANTGMSRNQANFLARLVWDQHKAARKEPA